MLSAYARTVMPCRTKASRKKVANVSAILQLYPSVISRHVLDLIFTKSVQTMKKFEGQKCNKTSKNMRKITQETMYYAGFTNLFTNQSARQASRWMRVHNPHPLEDHMTIRSITLMALCAATLTFAGCGGRIAQFTVVSNKNVELSRVDLKKTPPVRDVKGESTQWWILSLIPLGGSPTIEDAMNDCLAKGGGDLMTSAEVSEDHWSALLLGKRTIEVKGDVVNSLSAGAADIQKGK